MNSQNCFDMMTRQKIRDVLRFMCAVFFLPIYIPHLLVYGLGGGKLLIKRDVERTGTDYLTLNSFWGLLYLLHTNRYFRTLFYHRIGPIISLLIEWWRPGDKYFIISKTCKIGPGVKIAHPYATILNAESIGCNFTCIHCTTLGAKINGRPIIGDNVQLGANATIVGNVRIGNNVTIGAGAVVVKDIPDNAIAVGNPAKVIRFKN